MALSERAALPIAKLRNPQKLEASDIPNLYSMPSPEEMERIDECSISCKQCGVIFDLVLDNHALNKGMCQALLQHSRAHQPGQPGIRRRR